MIRINTNIILDKIFQAANLYKELLIGRRFLYIFNDTQYIEVLFQRKHFKHLTGVGTNINAKRFFDMAINRTLARNQIFFDSQHPLDLCIRKLSQFQNITNIVNGNCFMLKDISTQTKKYKFGTTDLNLTLCIDTVNSNQYIPISLRDEDCFSKCSDAYIVNYIFSKNTDEKLYNKLLYPTPTEHLDVSSLPQNIVSMLDLKLFI